MVTKTTMTSQAALEYFALTQPKPSVGKGMGMGVRGKGRFKNGGWASTMVISASVAKKGRADRESIDLDCRRCQYSLVSCRRSKSY